MRDTNTWYQKFVSSCQAAVNLLLSFLLVLPQMAISAASPAFQGTLTDIDCRWDVIAGSVDDRTDEERGLKV